jgi:hypothetical protein
MERAPFAGITFVCPAVSEARIESHPFCGALASPTMCPGGSPGRGMAMSSTHHGDLLSNFASVPRQYSWVCATLQR